METLKSSHHIASWITFRQEEGCEVEAVSEVLRTRSEMKS